ncbi:hypothetical protein [Priestia megaterium]|uniref:hypothetical protein n=1 Tax=Priestia megaterium TaxID=1404 RepID=UPI000BFE3135|nr:hypothetical protein [Priestia megaterium]PGO60738.1 hypothetical protein CN981_09375 [Priestia megaterium]
MNEALQEIKKSEQYNRKVLKWIIGIMLVFTLVMISLVTVNMKTDYQYPWIQLTQDLLGCSINVASSVFIFFTGRKYLRDSKKREAEQDKMRKMWEEQGYGEYFGFDHKASRRKMIQMYIALHGLNVFIIFMNLKGYIL